MAIVLFEPRLEDWPGRGVYQVWLRVAEPIRVRVGALGRCAFPAGVYVYTGRAARGLATRVLRHVRVCGRCRTRERGGERPPKVRWHIDYLLRHRAVRIERVVLASSAPADECRVNKSAGGQVAVAGFGASDCRNGCGAHLVLL